MEITTFIDKNPAKLVGEQVQYFLFHNEVYLELNEWVDKSLRIEFTGRLQCVDCQKIVKKFYAPGLCYLCMQSSAMNSPCIINPELCEAHLGKGKVIEWEEKYHNQPHIVYLANSGGLKVGVTRVDQIPTRWIDQGADEAIILAKTPYRQLAGEIEVALKDYLSDKTNWRLMLRNEKNTSIDLINEKEKIINTLLTINPGFEDFISEDQTVYVLNFPTKIISNSINSLKLDKQPIIEGVLSGIKAQYFIFDQKNVVNMRSHMGYEVNLKLN